MKASTFLALSLSLMMQLACATHGTVVVRTEPPEASVFIFDTKTGQNSLLGKTPLSFSKKVMGGDSGAEVFQLRIEKEGFESKYASVSAFGRETTYMDLKLSTALASNNEVRKAFELNRQLLQDANRLAAGKRYSEALARIEKILESDPKNDEAHAAKGSLMFLMKDYDGAQTSWKKALELNPSNDLVRSSLVDLNLNTSTATRTPAATGR